MKKHNDDWEEFLKQREQEKPAEDAELQELLKHDHASKKNNFNKNMRSNNILENKKEDSFTNSKKVVENNQNTFSLEDRCADEDFDINSLSKEEILGGVTTYDEADRLYEETYKKYEEAFEKWEVDPDNEELQKNLDIASNINDIAQKRLSIFQERELNDLKQKRIQFEQSSTTSNKTRNKKAVSRIVPGIVVIIAIASFFAMIALSANGVKYASAIFPCVMIVAAFIFIYIIFIAPQFKALQIEATKAKQQSEDKQHDSDYNNESTQTKPITQKALMLNKILVLLFLATLMGFLFLAVFGGVNKSLPMIFTGVGGFVGLILISAFISNIIKKHKQTAVPVKGTVKSCSPEVKDDENGNLNNFYKVVIFANNNYYVCYSKKEYSEGSLVTIYLDPKNKQKCYIKE